jgi:hypothetical protein
VGKLGRRDRDLLRLGALGWNDKAIAAELGIAPNSVKVYFARLRKRIGRFDRAMLPGIGLLLGIVSLADITRWALEFLQEFESNSSTPVAEAIEAAGLEPNQQGKPTNQLPEDFPSESEINSKWNNERMPWPEDYSKVQSRHNSPLSE